MKNIADLLGKPVISIYESETMGIIKNVVFNDDFKKVKYLVLFNDSELQEEYVIKASDIYCFGKDALMVKNNECLILKTNLEIIDNNPMNYLAYKINGELVGKIIDIVIDDKNHIKKLLLTNGQQIDIKLVAKNGKGILLVQDDEKLVRISNFKRKTAKTEITEKIIVKALEDNSKENELKIKQLESQSETNTIIPIEPKKKVVLDSNDLPSKTTTKDNFLIGRKVSKNIYSFNNEIIIKKGIRITDKIILKAKEFSKLKELAIFSE